MSRLERSFEQYATAKIAHQRRVPCAGGERRFLFPATRLRFASAYSRIMSVNARSPAGT
jgi:hypothetical protein